MGVLKPKHVKTIRSLVPGFLEYMETGEGRRSLEERVRRKKLFRSYFGRESIDDLTEEQFRHVVRILWANAMWTDKDYIADRILRATPFPELRERLKDLLWGDRPLRERYDEFMRRVKYVKTAQATEIMCFTRPGEYAMWNRRVMEALSHLGFSDVLPVRKYRPSGADYERIVAAFKEIGDILRREGVPDVDLTVVDLLFWYVDTCLIPAGERRVGYTHDEIVEILLAVGRSLGFDVDREVPVARGARVDAVWSARVGNLGVIKYVFEVHMRGSIDSLILNLQKALKSPQVQKAVVVSTSEKLKRIEEEVEAVSKDFARYFSYLEIEDVIKARELLEELNKILAKLELVPHQ
ncbi:MAG: hypothetical protein DRJ67_10155 [Thermoprotei archaeon]|nr:MAG: hypothetical protein DRJ67_10155 [Thermoprotei archaeon]